MKETLMKVYKPNPVDTTDVQIPTELTGLLENMARNTHEVWAQGRIAQGWEYGATRDDKAKRHPCLVPYQDLPESEKEYDRNTAEQTIKLILKYGFTISKPVNDSLSSVEWDTCWMAIRYAMNRETIASASLPRELLRAYYDRWSDVQKRTIADNLRDHYEDFGCFGNKNIDHPDWMRFMLTLAQKGHYMVTASDGKTTETVECIEYDGKYYPISGRQKWWDGVGELYVAEACMKSIKAK